MAKPSVGLRWGLVVVLCCAGGLASATPPDPPPGDEASQARALYDKGMAHFHLEEYDQAIERWEAGFRLKPAPEFLYNIAQAHRLAKHADRALSFYQRYLRLAPKAPNRAEVERQIAALEVVVRQAAASATAPPTGTREPVATNPEHPAGDTTSANPTSTAETATTAPTTNATVVAQPPPRKPLYKKGWFWGVIAGSAVVVIAVGVGVGVAVSRADHTPTLTEVRF